MKQIHQKELEDKEEELEDVHKSSQRRVGRHYSSGEKVDEGPDSSLHRDRYQVSDPVRSHLHDRLWMIDASRSQ